MALQPGGYTDNPETDNTTNAHPDLIEEKYRAF